MIQTKCINGHFFDCEEYEYCPMCGALSIEKDKVPDEAKKKKGFDFFKPKPPIKPVETKPVPPGRVDKTFGILGFGKKNSDRIVTQPVNDTPLLDDNSNIADFEFEDDIYTESEPIVNDNNDVRQPETEQAPVQKNEIKADSGLGQQLANAQAKTIGFFSASNVSSVNSGAAVQSNPSAQYSGGPVEPVVGWLVAVKGEHLGECFNIYSGKSSMGRNPDNRIVFAKDGQISREKHAFIMYEPKKHEFFIQSGDSSGLTYVNNENIIGAKKIDAYDIIELGGSQFIFIPLCCDRFSWENYLGK